MGEGGDEVLGGYIRNMYSYLINEFKDKLIKDLLILGGIGLTFTIGIRRILGLVGRLGAAAFKITFNRILKTPIRAILRYLKNNVLNFKNQVISFFRSLPGGGLLGLLGSALISIPVVGPFLARKLNNRQQNPELYGEPERVIVAYK